MKKLLLALLLLPGLAYAKPIVGLNDYGELLSSDKFSTHCIIDDPGITGNPTINAYSHGQVDCKQIQKLYSDTYTHARDFLSSVYKFDFTKSAKIKTLSLRILTLAELNNPDNFSQTDKLCMYNAHCNSGAFFGRTFFADTSSNINVYVVHSSVSGKYSFVSTLKHELMHAILYRYRWNYLNDDDEHALIDKFLAWKKK